MEINYSIFFIAGIVTLFTGFVWYHPKVFGTIWMKENNFTQEELRKGNMLKIFGLTYLFSVMLASALLSFTIHQSGAIGMIGGPPEIAAAKPSFHAFMADYGKHFRTFKHGALHGFISGLFFALPIIGINGLFERKSWKYILIHAGFWMLSLTIMGGLICQFA
ncbi:DUF1761 domain-containing protein [Flavobacterium foetidum]|uniref:DUF1761 domain-containing protein n=1 Tax=Flavobacterium foetidum TaxID=2026681 RepID=UPI0010752601|nr:DUF1761 domain-containing protein [Flavobacterium foetidum]KAF2515237.1 DUF1761 domain-containing protein [Flavobacterium foetidum]